MPRALRRGACPEFSLVDVLIFKNNMNPWFTYIIECEDKSLYVGATSDVKRRFEQHKSGKGSKFVRSRKAVKIVYVEEFDNKYDALKREKQVKGFSRQKKLKLIK